MRTICIVMAGIVGIFVAGMAGTSLAFDAPHNETNNITCSDCHHFPLPAGVSPREDAKDSCSNCHMNETGGGYTKNSAPKVLNHSSATLGTKYGTWEIACMDCHRSHYQDQQFAYTAQSYVATGTITSITPIFIMGVITMTEYGYSNLSILRPEWSDLTKWGRKSGNDRGLVMYPNIAAAEAVISAEIVSATPATITVTGAPSPGAMVGNSFALIYGQLIRYDAYAPFGTVYPKFFSNTGQNSFANDESGTGTDPTPSGVCQVCHTQTQHWRKNGALAANHSSGDNCTACHRHEEGFAPNCNTCHGFPPVTNTLGPNGLAYNDGGTGAASPGTHATHAKGTAGNYGFACGKCHAGGMLLSPVSNKKIEIGFDISPAYQGGRYDGRALPLANGYSYSAGNASTTITNSGRQSCTNIYCHSNAKIGTPVESFAMPVWTNGPMTCVACHQYPPAYANGGPGAPTANSHVVHVINNGLGCQQCHSNTISPSGASLYVKFHVDTNIDVNFDTGSPAGTYAAATKTCSSISCHGAGAPQWGGTIRCQDCHLGNADVDDFAGTFWDNGTTASVGNAGEWNSTGHGRPAGSYSSGNPAAGFTVSDACLYCHDETIAHKTTANPFRLRNFADGTWGKNGNCQLCHAAGSPGMTVNGVPKNGTKKVGSTHFGTKHGGANNGGQFCWDCHDPHGDNNIFMIQASVARTSDATTGAPTASVMTNFTALGTGTDYAKNAAPFNGICNVCHASANHYTATSGDSHNSGIRCTNCHKHTGDTLNDAFKPSGENCYDCHSSAGGPTPGTTPDAYHARHIKNAFAGKVSLGDYGSSAKGWYRQSNVGGVPDFGCGHCHPQSSATHMDGKIDLNFSPTDGGAAGTLKAKNGSLPAYSQNTKVNVTCSSVYCHSNGYNPGTGYGYQTSDNWYAVSITGDVCSKCHGNSPNTGRPGSPAHAKHAVGIHYTNIFTGTAGLSTAGAGSSGSHGNAMTSTTISCNICHSATVSTSANDANSVCSSCHTGASQKGAMMIAASSTTHVNGVADVVFPGISFRSRAQIRDNIASAPELADNWTRVGGYKGPGSYDMTVSPLNASSYVGGNCTVACHNGRTVRWNSAVTCTSCHTDLP